MGTFRIKVEVANIVKRTRATVVPGALVDTGSEYTWLPTDALTSIGVKREKKDVAFIMANGQTVTRSVGFAVVRVGDAFTVDEIVFGEAGDQSLLGARTLEGLNLTVDAARKRLVAAGPLPAARCCVSDRCSSQISISDLPATAGASCRRTEHSVPLRPASSIEYGSLV